MKSFCLSGVSGFGSCVCVFSFQVFQVSQGEDFYGLIFLIFILEILMLKGTRVMEFICVTNVDGHFQIHIRVPSTGVLIRRSVEPLKVTNCPPPRDNPI